jgi:hypothetical protein
VRGAALPANPALLGEVFEHLGDEEGIAFRLVQQGTRQRLGQFLVADQRPDLVERESVQNDVLAEPVTAQAPRCAPVRRADISSLVGPQSSRENVITMRGRCC